MPVTLLEFRIVLISPSFTANKYSAECCVRGCVSEHCRTAEQWFTINVINFNQNSPEINFEKKKIQDKKTAKRNGISAFCSLCPITKRLNCQTENLSFFFIPIFLFIYWRLVLMSGTKAITRNVAKANWNEMNLIRLPCKIWFRNQFEGCESTNNGFSFRRIFIIKNFNVNSARLLPQFPYIVESIGKCADSN